MMRTSAHFVNLVKNQQRIVAFRLNDSLHDASTHRSNIGAAVSTNFTFVMHSTERDALIFASEALGDAAAKRSFTYTRRAIKTENRGGMLFADFHHSQVFEDSLFHLLHSIVIAVKHSLGASQI